MKKNRMQALVILGIGAIAFSVIAFAVPFPKGAIFWIAYFAEILAIVLQIPIFKLAYHNTTDLKSKLLGFPVFRVGYIYLGIQTVVSIILFVLGFFKYFPVWIGTVLCVIILASAIVCSITADIAKDTVTKIETAQEADTRLMKDLQIKVQQLVNRTTDTTLKQQLKKIAENLQFSDPVSSPKIADEEQQLLKCFQQLESALATDDVSKVNMACENVKSALNNRNLACKRNK